MPYGATIAASGFGPFRVTLLACALFVTGAFAADTLSWAGDYAVRMRRIQRKIAIKPLHRRSVARKHVAISAAEMNRALAQSDSSVPIVMGFKSLSRHARRRNTLNQYAAAKSATQVANLVNDLPYPAAELLPLIYNVANKHVTLRELLGLVLAPEKKYGRTKGLVRWSPLLRAHLGRDVTQPMIETLLTKETTEDVFRPRTAYESLALLAPLWVDHVEPAFAATVFGKLLETNTDHALYHALPWRRLPATLRNARYDQYIKRPLAEIEVTRKVVPVKRQNLFAGTCREMQDYQWHTLIPPGRAYGEVVLGEAGIIRANGKALFSLALGTDPGMIALRTLMTPDGRFAAIRGGLYVPPKAIRDAFNDFDFGRETFRHLDLAEPLRVLPVGWVNTSDKIWSAEKFARYQTELDRIAAEHSD